ACRGPRAAIDGTASGAGRRRRAAVPAAEGPGPRQPRPRRDHRRGALRARAEPLCPGASDGPIRAAMSKPELPVTPAVRVLRQHRLKLEPHLYPYEEHGGTAHSAVSLRVPEHQVIKTLVFETEERKPLLVLQHGDLEVSAKGLARLLGVKRVTPCDQAT